VAILRKATKSISQIGETEDFARNFKGPLQKYPWNSYESMEKERKNGVEEEARGT
jgi:hypothetical protein